MKIIIVCICLVIAWIVFSIVAIQQQPEVEPEETISTTNTFEDAIISSECYPVAAVSQVFELKHEKFMLCNIGSRNIFALIGYEPTAIALSGMSELIINDGVCMRLQADLSRNTPVNKLKLAFIGSAAVGQVCIMYFLSYSLTITTPS